MDSNLILLQLLHEPVSFQRRIKELLLGVRRSVSGRAEVLEMLRNHLSITDKARRIQEALELHRIEFCPMGHSLYPEQLYRLMAPPLGLFVKPASLLPAASSCIAVVGSRQADHEGIHVTRSLVHALRQKNCTIVSGLAYGIDAAAHWAALEKSENSCPTIAVLPRGLDAVYPAAHEKLADHILSYGGVLVSEYMPGVTAHKFHFLERNRIVAGLSSAVVVTQSGYRSGALSTANHAAEQGTEVFAVPGPMNDPLYQGNHRIIRSGGQLLSSINDVLEHLESRGCQG